MLGLLARLRDRWRRVRRQPGETLPIPKIQGEGRGSGLERVNEDLRAVQEELQKRWKYLAESQRLSHSGTFGWKVDSGELIWSDETYRILGFTRETNPALDLAFDRIHPDDRDRLYQLRDRAARNGMDLDVEHRILLPDGAIKYIHLVAHSGRDGSGNLEYLGVVTDVTERKRADEERQALSRKLEESNARLEEAQRVAHLGYWIWDLETNRVTFSNETCRIYGLEPQEDPIDLETIRELIHPEDREYVFENARRAVRDGVAIETEHRLIHPSGEVRIVYSPGNLKRDAMGRPYQMFGTCQDITERRRAEEALKQTQFYLSEGQRLAHIGSWALNDSSHYWSDELYTIYGLDPKCGPPTVEQYLALVHPLDRASTAENIRLMKEEQRGFDHVERVIRSNGHLRYVRCVAVPVVENEIFKGFIGTTIDITEQELLTLELRREQAYLAEAQSLTHAGSWACNFLTGQIFHLSDEALRMYGLDPSGVPVPFERLYKATYPEDEPALRKKFYDAIQARMDYDLEYRIVRPDGAIRTLRSLGHHNPTQELGEYFGITMDITDQKNAAKEREELRQLEADLAHINRVNMMGELAAALAHELKQPLAASITSANALLRWLAHDPPDLERARAAAYRIELDANRAADVINSLQSFYKTGTPPKCQIVDVKEIIAEMTILLRGEADRHSITINFELEPDTPKIVAVRVQLQQVFMNLMLNAIEAMKDAGGELLIRLRSNPEGHLIVSISDTGIGLRTETTEQIFAPFHTTKSQGTGMGLTISRSIVESYGGRIWATNNKGAGATFHFTLSGKIEASA
jgi:PAS domain S-box-containing protein